VIHWVFYLVQWADGPRWRSMSSGFRGSRARFDSGDVVTGLLLLAGVALGVFVLSRLLSRQERQRAYNRPRALFRSLCKAHGLDRSSRQLLRQVARWQRLAQPARLFLEPNRFEPAALSPRLRAKGALLARLRDRIFAVSAESASATRPK
jgi:hypothetical protein